jgi:hypothetical protein
MSGEKLKKLFAASRKDTAPVPPEDFANDVLRMVRQEPPATRQINSLPDSVDRLFPRIAFAALAVIALCVAADYALTAAGMPELGDGLSLFSAQWFFI